MPIVNYKTPYLAKCYEIDLKCYLWPWTEEGWAKLNGYVLRVFLMADEVVGFYSFTVNDDTIVVSKFCVHPSYQRLDIGTELHADLIRIGKRYGKKHLEMMLHEDNACRDFIIKFGWRAKNVTKELFPDGRDGYLFRKELRC